MQIWVDADACPRAIKEILFRAAQRVRVRLTLVANQELHTPRSAWVRTVRVRPGLDQADRHIVGSMEPGDLVVTADVPLAAAVLKQGGHALDPRGVLYTEENIPERLAQRNLLDELRASGLVTGGPSALGTSGRQAFASRLDQILTRYGGG
jgi:uncharacterized protein YaiI (UPF0178 family)